MAQPQLGLEVLYVVPALAWVAAYLSLTVLTGAGGRAHFSASFSFQTSIEAASSLTAISMDVSRLFTHSQYSTSRFRAGLFFLGLTAPPPRAAGTSYSHRTA